MVRDELTDGTRIGRLLSSEIHGHERGVLGRLRIVDANADVEATDAGAFAFAVAAGDGEDTTESDADVPGRDGGSVGGDRAVTDGRMAEAYVHPDRLRVEFSVEPGTAASAGPDHGLRTRPKSVDPPRTLVFVENGAEVKAALRVVRAVAEERLQDGG